MLHLRTHAGDPELSADKLAAHFGISKRYLYAVLARMNIPLGEWIRTERLNRAARELTNPANAPVSIAAIARTSGFADHSSFSRAFKQQYGHTPSDWRLPHRSRPRHSPTGIGHAAGDRHDKRGHPPLRADRGRTSPDRVAPFGA